MNPEFIRNFSIIAHVDHGKSTLADRILQICNAVSPSKMRDQFLDKLELERERGITIKAQSVSLKFVDKDNSVYTLNLIDTPGHVDFSYEVSRSLAACEGALLVVDATQGVQAQTVANAYLAIENDLKIIPVINKIDLPNSDVNRCLDEIQEIIGLEINNYFCVSGKTGQGLQELIQDGIIKLIPPPKVTNTEVLKALVFDSWYDQYRGVVLQIRVFDGKLRVKDKITFCHSRKNYEVSYIGIFNPFEESVNELSGGMVGHIACGIKNIRDVRVGDTLTLSHMVDYVEPVKGFREIKPRVFGGLYPSDVDNFDDLRDALEKLALNDAALSYQVENSVALGMGFRCGFLGLLHMEITTERLEREYGIVPVVTTPNVSYLVELTNNEEIIVENPGMLPDPSRIKQIKEPICNVVIHSPSDFIGAILQICEEKRGIQKKFQVIGNKSIIEYEIPLAEIIVDFHDKIKAASKGYASFDYELKGYQPADIVKLQIRINGKEVDALSFLIHRTKSYELGRKVVDKLKDNIDRQLYELVIQACIGSKVIASSRVPPLRKNVTAKCYGGDITRKRKLLEKQKEGKKRMKMFGDVQVQPQIFLKILQE